jgi:pyruvate/2-oxoglutarate dehydrogenase complex dihydrolipoamide acyltransferase (E2) component
MEFESFNEGTLLYIGIQEGNAAPVDSLLAIIGPEGTDILVLLIIIRLKVQTNLQSPKKKLNQCQKKK